ncbi:MAG TPA: cytochrome b/b6 domain-containing protein [Gammaproteobacteria bacterium]
MNSTTTAGAAERASSRIERHALIDRLFHWVTAVTVLVLLATAFLPVLGVQFAWVTPHWIAGLVLIAAILFHVVRAPLAQSLRAMWIGADDLRDLAAIARFNLRLASAPPPKPGKYSLAQKLIHLLFAVVLLTAAVTGALMMVRMDTPWWQRNPYWLADSTWGIVYVLHGLAALLLVTMIIAHVYFALRPEKLLFTRSMIRGWITREEYERHHDPERWRVRE